MIRPWTGGWRCASLRPPRDGPARTNRSCWAAWAFLFDPRPRLEGIAAPRGGAAPARLYCTSIAHGRVFA